MTWAMLFGFLLGPSCIAQTRVLVNESAIRMQFRADATLVSLPVENRAGESIEYHVALELVDPAGLVLVRSRRAMRHEVWACNEPKVGVPIGSGTSPEKSPCLNSCPANSVCFP
jgi:hypothetical protein